MSNQIINDWAPETKSLLETLIAARFILVKGDNGEDKFKFDGDLPKFIDNLTACDEAHLFVTNPKGVCRCLFLVYGNEPGVLVSDYTCDDGLDAVTDAHYNKWENRKQPTSTEEEKYGIHRPQQAMTQVAVECFNDA